MKKLWIFRAILAFAVAAVMLAMLELALRGFPELLPESYVAADLIRGLWRFEIAHPGVLARTPIEGIPIPYQPVNTTLSEPPPADLVRAGLLSAEEIPEREREEVLHLVLDRYGLLNASDRDAADVVFVGDSFTYLTGVVDPPGLQSLLERETGLSVQNLGVPAIGPTRVDWVMRELGLPLDPKFVVWFFFGGNDIEEEESVLQHRERGIATYGDMFEQYVKPHSLALDVLKHFASFRKEDPRSLDRSGATLPGLKLAAAPDGPPLWFLPERVRSLTRSRTDWRRLTGWEPTVTLLRRAALDLRQRQIELLVVYVPSKPQVLLPHLVRDEDLLLRMANFGAKPPLSSSPPEFWERAMNHRSDLELLIRNLCRRQGIAFLSLTPALSAQAAAGTLGYWSADTHWNFAGQRAALAPLADWLRRATATAP